MITNWAILSVDERDFIAWGNIDLSKLPNISTKTNEYNQLEFEAMYGRNLCTVYWPIWVVADNYSTLTKEERRELSDKRYNMSDFNPAIWWYLHEWVNATRQYCKSKWINISSARIEVWSKDFYDLLDKGYRINIGMSIKEKYLSEILNWILDTAELGRRKSGHSLWIKKVWDNYLIDNYKNKLPHNKIKLTVLKELIANRTIYRWSYLLWVDRDNLIDKKKKEIMENINIEEAKEAFLKWIWNWERATEPVSREEAATMIMRAVEKYRNWEM